MCGVLRFSPVVREMMFGFGDSIEPHPQTVELMDQLVKDFMTNLVDVASLHSPVVSTVF